MILTLTPNPSLDLTYGLEELERGEVQRADVVSVEAGGKGVNVCRSLIANGVPSRAIATVGGASGEQFLALLEDSEVECVRVPVTGELRTNVSVVEHEGVVTKINAAGPRLSEGEVGLLLAETAAAARGGDWLAACGSLPPGAPEDLYARVVEVARAAGCRVAVDSSGSPLARALDAGPDLVKPNLEELCGLTGRRLGTIGDVLAAAGEVRARGAGAVVVSLGADGAILADGSGAVHAQTPPFTPRNTVGAGDSLLAGLLSVGGEGAAALAEGVAWGAAAARLPGTRGPSPPDIERESVSLRKDLELKRQLKGELKR